MAIRLTSGVYAKPLPIQRSSGLHDSWVRWDDTPTRSLIVTRWISHFLALPHRHEHTNRQFTQKCHSSRLNSSFEIPHFYLPTHSHIFLYKTNCIEFKVLSVLITINVQTHSDINPGGQGIIITNQGVAIQPCFQQAKHMQFCKTGHWVVVIKTRTKACIKGWDNLPSSKPSGKSWSKHCPSGSRSRNWSLFTGSQYCSSTGSPSFTPWSTTHTNKHTIKKKK